MTTVGIIDGALHVYTSRLVTKVAAEKPDIPSIQHEVDFTLLCKKNMLNKQRHLREHESGLRGPGNGQTKQGYVHPRYLSSLDGIWGRCSLVISPWGSDSEAFHSAEKKGRIPGGVFGIHQMATTGNVELTGRLLGITGVM